MARGSRCSHVTESCYTGGMPNPDPQEAKKTIRTFAAATFLNDLGSNMIYPIWPLFVTQVLKANMVAMGLLDGIGEGLLSISKAFSGYLSDRLHKRKVFIWLGYILSVLARIGYAAAAVWQHLIVFRILDRIGKERSAPRDALVADVSNSSNRGTNFGFIRAMDHLGALLGSLLVIFLIRVLGYRWIFALAAIPTLVSAALVFFLIKDRPAPSTGETGGVSFRLLGKDFRLFTLISSVFAFGAFSYSFLLLFAKDIGFSTPLVVALYPLFTAVASLSSWISGRLADRVGRKPVLLVSYALWVVVCVIFIVFRHPLVIIGSFVLFGAHKGILIPVQRTIVSECSLSNYRASYLGFFHMITGLCALPASFIAGILWETLGKTAPFVLSLGLSLVAVLILIVFFKPGTALDSD
jgi:MFS family permease